MIWTNKHHFRHMFIEPRKPMQDGYAESFYGKFRDCLNEHWSRLTLPAVRLIKAPANEIT